MKERIYQLLPRLWGSGKFSSIDTKSLEYLHTLGVDFIWLTGIIRHASRWGTSPQKVVKGDAGSPYAITDYYDVNPYLADCAENRMDEFENLLKRIHSAGFKFLIDFVPNHVAREYSGKAAPSGVITLGADDDSSVHWKAENDFFYYPGEALRLPVDSDYEEYPAKASGNTFTSAPGMNDWWETVKLNYCPYHTGTWDKMYEIVRFWALKGVDGFRCDMVELVPPEFMKWLISRIKEEFPSVRFVAEVYEKDKYRFYAEEVGFDLLYDKSGLYDTLRAVMCSGQTARSISWNWQSLGDLQPRMLNFLENHDEQRLASDFFARSPEAGYAALAVSLLLNDAPFMLYAGQEAGERGMRAEGFSGLDGRTSIFDWCHPDSLVHLANYIHGKPDGLDEEEKSVLQRYRELLQLSRKSVFSSGNTYDLCYCQGEGFNPDRHFAWLRYDKSECWLLLANFGAAADIKVHIPSDCGLPEGEYCVFVPSNDFALKHIFLK